MTDREKIKQTKNHSKVAKERERKRERERYQKMKVRVRQRERPEITRKNWVLSKIIDISSKKQTKSTLFAIVTKIIGSNTFEEVLQKISQHYYFYYSEIVYSQIFEHTQDSL